ncbi:MAG: ATPase [Candidatus Marinimicrobia bacterium]|nr:ATPase [Candidatus Neomarinimicrobiota bacterium]
MNKNIGKTKDAGYQFGIRRTFSHRADTMWDFLFSESGLQIWLGELQTRFEIKKEYKTDDGVEGVVRVFKPYSHTRLTWKKPGWENHSTVQVRVIDKGEKSVVSFHQEKLLNPDQRSEMKKYWSSRMQEIIDELSENQ